MSVLEMNSIVDLLISLYPQDTWANVTESAGDLARAARQQGQLHGPPLRARHGVRHPARRAPERAIRRDCGALGRWARVRPGEDLGPGERARQGRAAFGGRDDDDPQPRLDGLRPASGLGCPEGEPALALAGRPGGRVVPPRAVGRARLSEGTERQGHPAARTDHDRRRRLRRDDHGHAVPRRRAPRSRRSTNWSATPASSSTRTW